MLVVPEWFAAELKIFTDGHRLDQAELLVHHRHPLTTAVCGPAERDRDAVLCTGGGESRPCAPRPPRTRPAPPNGSAPRVCPRRRRAAALLVPVREGAVRCAAPARSGPSARSPGGGGSGTGARS